MNHTKSRSPRSRSSGSDEQSLEWFSLTGSWLVLWDLLDVHLPTRFRFRGTLELLQIMTEPTCPQRAELRSIGIACMVFDLHAAGHLVILTFPVDQSMSGLCSTSQVCLRIMVVQPIPVMWRWLFPNVPVVDHEVNDFCDVASIIEGPIHIVDRMARGDVGCVGSWI